MAQEERPIDLGRPELTVTEYLFRIPYYEGKVQFAAEDPLFRPDPAVSGRVSLAPKHRDLPAVSATATTTPDGGAATFDVRSENVPVSYSREYRDGTYKDIVRGQAGPFGAFVSKLKGDGERDLVESAIGASVRAGPVTLYGEQSRASWEDRNPWTGQLHRNMDYARYLENTRIDEQNRRIGAAIEGPLGKGVAGLDVARAYRESLLPNRRGRPRPTVSAPHTTSLGARWQGPLGPGRLGLQGGVDFIRDRGTSSNLGANYIIEDPLGLGGRFNINAGWQNPYGGPGNWQARIGYGLRF